MPQAGVKRIGEEGLVAVRSRRLGIEPVRDPDLVVQGIAADSQEGGVLRLPPEPTAPGLARGNIGYDGDAAADAGRLRELGVGDDRGIRDLLNQPVAVKGRRDAQRGCVGLGGHRFLQYRGDGLGVEQ